MFFIGYRCSVCGAEYDETECTYTCPIDNGNLDVLMDFSTLKKKPAETLIHASVQSMWRYLPLLPVGDPDANGTPLASVGWTPVYTPQTLVERLGVRNLWIKDESSNPTASFKDRASAVIIARAREIGADIIVTASTGNAGAALAGMAAAVGQKAVIFAPRSAPPAKIAQLLIFGAQVLLVDGNYDQAFDLSVSCADAFGWYCRNTGYNPFTAEGKKTAAFEIWEQVYLREKAHQPVCIFVSVGDGNIIAGIYKGFKDLADLGLIEQMPRIFGVQARGSASIAHAFQNGDEQILPVHATTIADSISVDLPKDGLRGLRAATKTNGAYITVPDEMILSAIKDLGSAGIFAEPAGAAAFAGLVQARADGLITSDDQVVVLNTGSGLKDIQAAMSAAPKAVVIEPTMHAVKKALEL